MSKYTTEVRFVCEEYSGLRQSVEYPDIGSVISTAAPKIFDHYPIFDEAFRPVLNGMILRHFYFREIGFETVGLWKHFLNTRLGEIMPYYNQLYKSQLLEFNPFYDVDYTRDGNRKHNETGNETEKDITAQSALSNSTNDIQATRKDTNQTTDNGSTSTESTSSTSDRSTTDNTDKYLDTPQGSIDGVLETKYLTNARLINATGDKNTSQSSNSTVDANNITEGIADSNSTTTIKANDTTNLDITKDGNRNFTNDKLEDYMEKVKGKMGTQSYASLLLEYRQTFLNITREVINNLNDLFMNIY